MMMFEFPESVNFGPAAVACRVKVGRDYEVIRVRTQHFTILPPVAMASRGRIDSSSIKQLALK